MPLYNQNQAMNCQNLGSLPSWICSSGVLGYDRAKMRDTILQQESIFRNQILELHRIYGRQKELMDEIRRRGIDRHLWHERSPKLPQASYDGDIELSLRSAWRSNCDAADSLTLNLVSKGFSQNPVKWEGSARHLHHDFSEKRTWLDHGKSSAFLESRLAEAKEPVSSRKRKLFGVEISDVNEVSDTEKQSSDSKDNCLQGCNAVESTLFQVLKPECGTNSDHLKSKSLPWFLRNTEKNSDMPNGMKSAYFMNLESLQNCTRSFFKKAAETPAEIVAQKTGDAAENNSEKAQIDLNLSLDEEDSPPTHHVSANIEQIAAMAIDLELCPEEADFCNEEYDDRLAAEAIIAFSLEKSVDAVYPSELRWFADIIFSELEEIRTSHGEEESIPDGMDHFEFVTLKLEDCKEKHLDFRPVVFNGDEKDSHIDTHNVATRTRRQTRRWRPRKDFQRDILPGLGRLSRLEVSEDLQAFEELMKAQGDGCPTQRGAARNNRGRKRMICGGIPATPPPKTRGVCSSNASQPVWQLKERSLTGWGKRTKRLPRQRCPTGFLRLPIKC